MTDVIVDSSSDPIQVNFFIAHESQPLELSKLGPLNLPMRSFVPEIGSMVSEFRPEGSIPYQVIGREFDTSGDRVALTLEPTESGPSGRA